MKPVLVISLLLILGFSHIGYYFVVQHEQQKVKESSRERIIAGINEAELTLINYSAEQQHINWEEEEENEFSYKGKMYDVVYRSTANGKIMLHCISDEKETQLVEKYKTAKDNNGIEKKQKNGGDQNNLFVYEKKDEPKQFNTAQQTVTTAGNQRDLAKGSFTKNSPPPKA